MNALTTVGVTTTVTTTKMSPLNVILPPHLQLQTVYVHLYFVRKGVKKRKKTKREKYTARQSNTIPAATWTYI